MTMKTLKQILTDYKERVKRNKIEALKNSFDVAEKNGKIFITQNGSAFAVMETYTSAREITERLESARRAALEYDGI